jgi:hypothetical protein
MGFFPDPVDPDDVEFRKNHRSPCGRVRPKMPCQASSLSSYSWADQRRPPSS